MVVGVKYKLQKRIGSTVATDSIAAKYTSVCASCSIQLCVSEIL